MVITKLIGGLGNQMFQYAAGRSLAHRHNTELKLDITNFKNYPDRFYSLNCFNILEEFASPKEIFVFTGIPRNFLQKLITQGRRSFRFAGKALLQGTQEITGDPKVYKEPHFHFDRNFFYQTDNVYLDGYWQSERYFKDIEEIIRNEFTFKIPPLGKNKGVAEQIASCESVSIHVRRGDYVNDLKISEIHGNCGLTYYREAVKKISQMIRAPHFFIFSDEPGWARKNLRLGQPAMFVDHNDTNKSYEDLRLMSQCKHHIIANSSFSWWGAWLHINPEKIVIAPKKWFRSDDKDTKDLIPDSWLRI